MKIVVIGGSGLIGSKLVTRRRRLHPPDVSQRPPPIAAGRELWGFPRKLAQPTLEVETDTLVGTLNYGPAATQTTELPRIRQFRENWNAREREIGE